MHGVITGSDAWRNLPLIWTEYGFATAARVLVALVSHRKTTFLEVVFNLPRCAIPALRPPAAVIPPGLARPVFPGPSWR